MCILEQDFITGAFHLLPRKTRACWHASTATKQIVGVKFTKNHARRKVCFDRNIDFKPISEIEILYLIPTGHIFSWQFNTNWGIAIGARPEGKMELLRWSATHGYSRPSWIRMVGRVPLRGLKNGYPPSLTSAIARYRRY